MSYEIDPDALFSDGEDDGREHSPSSPLQQSTLPPSPKRPRHASASIPPRAPSLGPLKLSLPSTTVPSSANPSSSAPRATAIAPPFVPQQQQQQHHQHNHHQQNQYQHQYQQNRRHQNNYHNHSHHQSQNHNYSYNQNRNRPNYHSANGRGGAGAGRGGGAAANTYYQTQYYNQHNQHQYSQQPSYNSNNSYNNNSSNYNNTNFNNNSNNSYHHRYNNNQNHQMRQQQQLVEPISAAKSDAASILPQASRKRLEESEKNKANSSMATSILPQSSRKRLMEFDEKEQVTKQAAQRKKPGRRRLVTSAAQSEKLRYGNETAVQTSSLTQQRKKNLILQNVRRAQSTKPAFDGLESLLKESEKAVDQGLIKFNDVVKENKKRKLSTSATDSNIYTDIMMTKEMKEREERERIEKENQIKEEEMKVHNFYKEKRKQHRIDMEQLIQEWKQAETVANSMRQAYKLNRVERWLFHEQKDCADLKRFGLNLKQLPNLNNYDSVDPENKFAEQLLKVDVIEI